MKEPSVVPHMEQSKPALPPCSTETDSGHSQPHTQSLVVLCVWISRWARWRDQHKGPFGALPVVLCQYNVLLIAGWWNLTFFTVSSQCCCSNTSSLSRLYCWLTQCYFEPSFITAPSDWTHISQLIFPANFATPTVYPGSWSVFECVCVCDSAHSQPLSS